MHFLAEKGYDIIHIGLEFPSVSDEEVIEIAIKQNRIILTFDSDYGTLVFQKGYKPLGVIYLRDLSLSFLAITYTHFFYLNYIPLRINLL